MLPLPVMLPLDLPRSTTLTVCCSFPCSPVSKGPPRQGWLPGDQGTQWNRALTDVTPNSGTGEGFLVVDLPAWRKVLLDPQPVYHCRLRSGKEMEGMVSPLRCILDLSRLTA